MWSVCLDQPVIQPGLHPSSPVCVAHTAIDTKESKESLCIPPVSIGKSNGAYLPIRLFHVFSIRYRLLICSVTPSIVCRTQYDWPWSIAYLTALSSELWSASSTPSPRWAPKRTSRGCSCLRGSGVIVVTRDRFWSSGGIVFDTRSGSSRRIASGSCRRPGASGNAWPGRWRHGAGSPLGGAYSQMGVT